MDADSLPVTNISINGMSMSIKAELKYDVGIDRHKLESLKRYLKLSFFRCIKTLLKDTTEHPPV